MSNYMRDLIWNHSELTGNAFNVLLAIGSFFNEGRQGAFAAVSTLAKKAHVSERCFQDHVRAARDRGDLVIRPGEGLNGTNLLVPQVEKFKKRPCQDPKSCAFCLAQGVQTASKKAAARGAKRGKSDTPFAPKLLKKSINQGRDLEREKKPANSLSAAPPVTQVSSGAGSREPEPPRKEKPALPKPIRFTYAEIAPRLTPSMFELARTRRKFTDEQAAFTIEKFSLHPNQLGYFTETEWQAKASIWILTERPQQPERSTYERFSTTSRTRSQRETEAMHRFMATPAGGNQNPAEWMGID